MSSAVIELELAAVERSLASVVGSQVALLGDASRHILGAGGKRLRPRVVLNSYAAAGGREMNEAVPLAAAVELVHTATLVHDDINDHSPTRRGKVAVHARWGRTFALLTGDYLFAKVYELMAPYGPQINMIMAAACVALVEGETLQAEAAKQGAIDRHAYKRIVELKTASLFEAAARMGGLLGGGAEPVANSLGQFGHYLGFTFQIIDDVLDIVGDPDRLGKPVGSDVVGSRGALIAQNGPMLDGNAADVAAKVADRDPLQEMLANLRESGAVEVARVQAAESARKAKEALRALPPSPSRDALESLATQVLERDS